MSKENQKRQNKMIGKQSIEFGSPVWIQCSASIVGKKEGQGPLGKLFDKINTDDMFGGNSWEEAESALQKETVQLCLEKSNTKIEDVRYIFAGDLLAQSIASSFGLAEFNTPLFGLYGACSTSALSITLGSIAVAAGVADKVMCVTSSHFASAEKEFRFPLAYGNQRPLAATWTVTGSGAVVVGNKTALERCRAQREETLSGHGKQPVPGAEVIVAGGTVGKVTDYGVKDKANMGACMAPAAAAVVEAHLRDFQRTPEDYDKIITGDLGSVGAKIFADLLGQKGYRVEPVQEDCGLLIYDNELQDTHSGGSGCGCSASTLAGYLLDKLYEGEWNRILFVPTGALLSPVSANEGSSIPGIAHAIVLERKQEVR